MTSNRFGTISWVLTLLTLAAQKNRRVAGSFCIWRRGRDSNPGTPVKMLLEFQSSAFDRSATSPHLENLYCIARAPAETSFQSVQRVTRTIQLRRLGCNPSSFSAAHAGITSQPTAIPTHHASRALGGAQLTQAVAFRQTRRQPAAWPPALFHGAQPTAASTANGCRRASNPFSPPPTWLESGWIR